jgi:hypothetical protein
VVRCEVGSYPPGCVGSGARLLGEHGLALSAPLPDSVFLLALRGALDSLTRAEGRWLAVIGLIRSESDPGPASHSCCRTVVVVRQQRFSPAAACTVSMLADD